MGTYLGTMGPDDHTGAETVMYGLDGDDELIFFTGGTGHSALYGGEGNDILRFKGYVSGEGHGGNGNDYIIFEGSQTGGFNFYGDGGNDTLWGGIAGAALYGGAGNDELVGSLGADWLYGGEQNDWIAAGDGDDLLEGGRGTDGLFGDYGDDVIYGGEGDDAAGTIKVGVPQNTRETGLYGGEGADFIDGGRGNDALFSNLADMKNDFAVDLLYGGLGDDSYYVDSSADRVFERGGEGYDTVYVAASYTLAKGQEIEALHIRAGNTDVPGINLTGNEFDNELSGNFAANVLNGGAGADLMVGGSGNDTYHVDNAKDVVNEGGDDASDTIIATINFNLKPSARVVGDVENLTLVGSAATVGTGNELANILGSTTAGVAHTYTGLGGNDTYRIVNKNDVIVESSSQGTADRIVASVDYVLKSGVYVEIMQTNGPSTTTAIDLTGNRLKQTIIGNAGANILNDGGAGASDTMSGLAGNDSYWINNSGTTITEAASHGTADRIVSTVDYVLRTGVFVEVMQTAAPTGKTGIDFTGNSHAQTLIGNAGTNFLDGKSGIDRMTGGAGTDHFVFSTGIGPGNVDTITDFKAADDTIRLENAIFTKLKSTGTVTSSYLRINKTGKAEDANDFLVYESDTGKLFYDADGSGNGAGIHFATLTGAPTITNADIYVI